MKAQPVIAVVGATGVVGNEMVSVIADRKVPFSDLRLLASEDSVGELYEVGSDSYEVELLTTEAFEGVDIALFATSAALSKEFVPHALQAGAIVIDNSSHFRMDPTVPLVVPEVNFQAIDDETKLVANPNCSTIQLVPVLKAIHDAFGLKRVVVSTYQSVSGAGKGGLDELWAQTLAIFSQKDFGQEVFPRQIAFNCIPQIDDFVESGYTKEEVKVIEESRKILALPDLRITVTAVRVPVFHSHGESVNIETRDPISPAALVEILQGVPGITVYSEPDSYPVQLEVAQTDEIHVGRIRTDESVDNGVNLWIVADNVRKGAALNAVQIAERFITRQ